MSPNREAPAPPRSYWNHNVAYHRWIMAAAGRLRGDVLDVGCGDGLLLERLAPLSRSVTGVEPDGPTAAWAGDRLASIPNANVLHARFEEVLPASGKFDLITFVASIHHMDLRSALEHARALLAPGGELMVVGLSANVTAADWFFAVADVPGAFIGSKLHGETRDIGVPVAAPREGLAEVTSVAAQVLPGVHIRRALYYRYLLRWRAPSTADEGATPSSQRR